MYKRISRNFCMYKYMYIYLIMLIYWQQFPLRSKMGVGWALSFPLHFPLILYVTNDWVALPGENWTKHVHSNIIKILRYFYIFKKENPFTWKNPYLLIYLDPDIKVEKQLLQVPCSWSRWNTDNDGIRTSYLHCFLCHIWRQYGFV